MGKLRMVVAGLVVTLMGALAMGDAATNIHTLPAATQSADSYTVGEMRVQTLPGFTYFYASGETTFQKIGDFVMPLMQELGKLNDDGKVVFHGGAVFAYRDVKGMDAPFTLEVGFEAKDGTKPQGQFKVRKTEPFHCATILYSGSLKHLSEAYGKLMGEMAKKGLRPQGEAREAYLAWDGPELENNVVQIQFEIAGEAAATQAK